MTIPIYSSSASHIRINLFEIAIGIIRKYSKDEDYLIEIDLDFRSFFEDYIGEKLYIVNNRYIVGESSLRYFYDDEDGVHEVVSYKKIIPYSQLEAMNLLENLIREGLNDIFLENVSITRIGAIMNITLSLGEVSIEDFKNKILHLLDNKISKLGLLYKQEIIENALWSKIYTFSKRYDSSVIDISKDDVFIPGINKDLLINNPDDMGFFKIYLYKNANELFLYKLMFLGKIKSFEYIGINTIKIVLNADILDFLKREDKGIIFNEANSILIIFGVEYKLRAGTNIYKILRELLLNDGTCVYSPNELLEAIDVSSHDPYAYVKQAKSDIKKKYGKEVADLIEIKSKMISLNKK